jgi:hypothetical protein
MTPPLSMSRPDASAAEPFWRRRAIALAARLNFHHLLARAVPKLSILLVLLALFDLFRREISLSGRWSLALLL